MAGSTAAAGDQVDRTSCRESAAPVSRLEVTPSTSPRRSGRDSMGALLASPVSPANHVSPAAFAAAFSVLAAS